MALHKPENTLTTQQIRTFRKKVYGYFSRHGRVLPWRTEYDPYHILVSEIMLQQTQVDRVIPKFDAFIKRFPDITTLARAHFSSVLKEWKGLGYNRRAVSLQESAKTIVSSHHVRVPDDPAILVQLPGIGPATAASIAAFAYNRPTLFLETNIRTVFIYHFLSEKKEVRDSDILPLAEAALDRVHARKWYSALMDYGTILKQRVGNLTRRSATYKTQSPFTGSRRQIRGQILEILLENRSLSSVQIAAILEKDHETIRQLLYDLTEEGMLTCHRKRFQITQ